MLEGEKIGINCPKCKAINEVSIQQIADQSSIVCSSCKTNIQLKDDHGNAKKAIKDNRRKGYKG